MAHFGKIKTTKKKKHKKKDSTAKNTALPFYLSTLYTN